MGYACSLLKLYTFFSKNALKTERHLSSSLDCPCPHFYRSIPLPFLAWVTAVMSLLSLLASICFPSPHFMEEYQINFKVNFYDVGFLLLPLWLEPSSSAPHKGSLAVGLVVVSSPSSCTSPVSVSGFFSIGGHLPHLIAFLPLLFVASPFHCLLPLNSPPPLRHSFTSPIPGYCPFLHL